LPKYFSPNNLLDIVIDVFSNITVTGNSDIIELNNDLQIVFDSWIIYMPNLTQEHLMPHIIEAPMEISQQLTNEHILKDIAIESPYDIVPRSIIGFLV
jgi:chromatin remodeling complex protein RSC6